MAQLLCLTDNLRAFRAVVIIFTERVLPLFDPYPFMKFGSETS